MNILNQTTVSSLTLLTTQLNLMRTHDKLKGWIKKIK
jgi:hypothetical protein